MIIVSKIGIQYFVTYNHHLDDVITKDLLCKYIFIRSFRCPTNTIVNKTMSMILKGNSQESGKSSKNEKNYALCGIFCILVHVGPGLGQSPPPPLKPQIHAGPK